MMIQGGNECGLGNDELYRGIFFFFFSRLHETAAIVRGILSGLREINGLGANLYVLEGRSLDFLFDIGLIMLNDIGPRLWSPRIKGCRVARGLVGLSDGIERNNFRLMACWRGLIGEISFE